MSIDPLDNTRLDVKFPDNPFRVGDRVVTTCQCSSCTALELNSSGGTVIRINSPSMVVVTPPKYSERHTYFHIEHLRLRHEYEEANNAD